MGSGRAHEASILEESKTNRLKIVRMGSEDINKKRAFVLRQRTAAFCRQGFQHRICFAKREQRQGIDGVHVEPRR